MTTSKTKSKPTTNDILKAIDWALVNQNKSYATLATANNILIQKGLFTKKDQENKVLKKLLEEGKIAHAYQTDNKPRQWRIPLSEKGHTALQKKKEKERKKKAFEKEELKKEFGSISNQADSMDGETNSFLKWYQDFDDRQKKGFRRLVFIIIISAIIIIANIFPDNRSELVKTLDARYVGREWTDYEYQTFESRYGPGRPLRYEDYRWVYYYPKGNFTLTISKKNNRILEISDGKD